MLETGGEENARIYVLGEEERTVNVLTLEEGSAPAEGEIVLDRACAGGYAVGDEIELSVGGFTLTLRVSGLYASPLLFSQEGEPGGDGQTLAYVAYLPASSLGAAASLLPVTQVYLQFRARRRTAIFRKSTKTLPRRRSRSLRGSSPHLPFSRLRRMRAA